jgi:GT2 family glycosyltransferase
MNFAWRTALTESFDAYLWLNDDVVLSETAIAVLVETFTQHQESKGEACIVAGCLKDPETDAYTYGVALRGSTWHPGRWIMIEPSATESTLVESFHGNVVLVPHAVVDKIGIIDEVFSHGMGDSDYSLRALKAGIPIVAAPGYVGTCQMNPAQPNNLRELLGRKFVPATDWWIMSRRHARRLTWPFVFVSPYVSMIIPRTWRAALRNNRSKNWDRP